MSTSSATHFLRTSCFHVSRCFAASTTVRISITVFAVLVVAVLVVHGVHAVVVLAAVVHVVVRAVAIASSSSRHS